jgi:signal transduction histidine kinase/CheY-like chemotaxis protein
MARTVRDAIQLAVLAGVYFATARLGLAFDAVAGFATLVWPPSGIGLAAVLLFGPRIAPGIAVGAMAANVLAGASPAVALGIALGNSLEALFGALAIRTVPGFRPSLDRIRDVLALVILGGVMSTVLGATTGVTSLYLGDVVDHDQFFSAWRAWWLGDLMGIIIITPFILVWSSQRFKRHHISRARLAEAGALVAAIGISGFLVFGAPNQFAFSFFPVLMWAALRFGQRGVVGTLFLISAIAITATTKGHGPFVGESLATSLIGLQAFMAWAAPTFLVLGAAASNLRDSEQRNARLYLAEQQARAEAENAVRARDAFLSIASHELRTPLGAIQMSVSLIDETPSPRAIRAIQRQTKRLTELVDNLLDVSRLTTGKMQLDFEPVDLTSVVRESMVRLSDEARRVNSAVELCADSPMFGFWDPLRVDQITTNLLSNAIKYGDGKPIQVRIEGDRDRARLTVTDQGLGIAPLDQARIFEQFERVVSPERPGGFGLGLWIVRQIVEAFGGTITVESEIGRGSIFRVELPRRVEEFAGLVQAAQSSANPAEDILVIEDDTELVAALSDNLRHRGYRVTSVANGQKALEYLSHCRAPRLIILDMMMPVMNGEEFLDARQQTPVLAGIPVVLLSADHQLAERAKDLPVADFLSKPVDLNALYNTIERHCPH